MKQYAKSQTPTRLAQGGITLEDWTFGPLLVTIKPSDIACGIRGNRSHCAIAESLRAAHAAGDVQINRSTAYVEMPHPVTGVNTLFRFTLPPATKQFVKTFDLTGIATPGAIFLVAPSEGNTLAKRYEYNAARRARIKSGAIIAKPRTRRPSTVLRSGAGFAPTVQIVP